ncbi:MAG: glutamate-cysteine ligase family protein [Gammaproteobacteria bacterium]
MGSEVPHRFFDADDFSHFRERLDEETALLKELFDSGGFSERGDVAGFELEAWLVDDNGEPTPDNDKFLDKLRSSLVVPELAKFNIELNGSPCALTGKVFSRLHDELAATWQQCQSTANAMGCGVVAIGTMPTAKEEIFDDENMSAMLRYKSLNDRVMALRDGRKLQISIDGEQPLSIEHHDVMLEAAATSFQIHLQCRPQHTVRDFNASLIAAAPLVAIAANSPFLFGHALWDESRIPLFEQSVDVGEHSEPRVTFGKGYVRESMFEIFEENRSDYPILLPVVENTPITRLSHLRFQNGTMWRWVRPLIGFDFDGQVHLRIEQRVPSAGPTLVDCVANAAFYFGLVRGFGLAVTAPESELSFADAKANFYNAARYGLGAQVCCFRAGKLVQVSIRKLIVEDLLPLAELGLQSLNIPNDEINNFLQIIAARADNSQNGAAWQRRWMKLNEGSLHDLVQAYREHQETDKPVHTWQL